MTHKEFGDMAEKMRPKLQGIAKRFLSVAEPSEEAEDIVQEAIITLWRLYRSDYGIVNPEALAVRITKNICVARYRRKKIMTQRIQDDNYPGGESSGRHLEESDNRHIENELLRHLTDTQRRLIRMRNDEGLTLDEIAEKTGKPKTSVKSAISSARRIMMDILDKRF